MRKLLAFIALLLASVSAAAFDVEGFKTGMPKALVLAAAEKSYKLVTIDETTYVANAPGGGYLSFNFCEDKLASVQQGFPANLRQVTLLVSELKAKYGNPFSTSAGSRAHSSGTVYEWGMWWNAGTEFVSIYFTGTEPGDSLSTSHQAKNKCFKVPR
jgi:hypothetical protein